MPSDAKPPFEADIGLEYLSSSNGPLFRAWVKAFPDLEAEDDQPGKALEELGKQMDAFLATAGWHKLEEEYHANLEGEETA